MFRTKIRIHTCKVILGTSLVWLLVFVALLTFFSDCSSGSGWGCAPSASPMAEVKHAPVANAQVSPVLEKQVEANEVVIPKKEDADHQKYRRSQLALWNPAPHVAEKPGLPGERGKAVIVPADQEAIMKEKFKLNQFNLMASDMISLNRSLTDVRLEG